MAKKKSAKSQLKKIKKSNPGLYVFLVILLIIAGIGITYFVGGFDSFLPESIKSSTIFKRDANSGNNGNGNGNGTGEHNHSEDGVTENIIYDDFQIHFMTLGDSSAGDSVYITLLVPISINIAKIKSLNMQLQHMVMLTIFTHIKNFFKIMHLIQ